MIYLELDIGKARENVVRKRKTPKEKSVILQVL